MIRKFITAFAMIASGMTAQTVQAMDKATETARDTGASGIWVLSNICYAGMKAQGNNSFWRVLALIFGLPVTLLTMLVVKEGSQQAYGIDLPKKAP